ncbi:MAG: hypothetical protein HUJ26_06325 [Planctomycetaceae bacterium]|nr:hypothetical protein [Planctomycetaceae bacterium]
MPVRMRTNRTVTSGPRPVQFGICLPVGWSHTIPAGAWEQSDGQSSLEVQFKPLTHYFDGSLQWLQVDMIWPADEEVPESGQVLLFPAEAPDEDSGLRQSSAAVSSLTVPWGEESLTFDVREGRLQCSGKSLFTGDGIVWQYRDDRGELHTPVWDSMVLEERGSVKTSILLRGRLKTKQAMLRMEARIVLFPEIEILRLETTLHNPRRAQHPGGIWDLGDKGSIFFRELSVQVHFRQSNESILSWSVDEDGPVNNRQVRYVKLYQDSSGGENWNSRNHVNAEGEIVPQFRGFQLDIDGQQERGDRATPSMGVSNERYAIGVVYPEFWQQFPKSLELSTSRLAVELFPGQTASPHELQGGERKTHRFWLSLSAGEGRDSVESVRGLTSPVVVIPDQDYFMSQGAISDGTNISACDRPHLDRLLQAALEGERSLYKSRERVDEYGWRNYGELVADHEEMYYSGPLPLVSHYNNQFDPIYGFLLNFLRVGDLRFFELADALARHVVDIDLYHTEEDKWAYNGGLYWHTDHYKHAHTATHRSFSKENRPEAGDYGGGPCNEQNYTTGLLLHYYLTGSSASREAVVQLADWVIQMDDGSRSLFRYLVSGPTGLASMTREESFHGPGRGAGNSINALLDAWALTWDAKYLKYAEALMRRCIHPADSIDELDLLNAEDRWSYTVFLTSLLKYLKLKSRFDRRDDAYWYGRCALVHYATWMSQHERPYLDAADELEYPTETWPAQDLRKANVLRNSACYVAEPLHTQLMERGTEIAERAWSDLWSFETAACARPLAILMVEGLKENATPRLSPSERVPERESIDSSQFGEPIHFEGQKTVVKRLLKQPHKLLKALLASS